MTNFNRNNVFNRPLLVLSAGLLLQAHSAFASDPNDAQAQARALLDRPVVHQSIAQESSAGTRAGDHHVIADAQELARALLTGKPITEGAAPPARVGKVAEEGASGASNRGRRAYSDPQEAARRMILGLT